MEISLFGLVRYFKIESYGDDTVLTNEYVALRKRMMFQKNDFLNSLSVGIISLYKIFWEIIFVGRYLIKKIQNFISNFGLVDSER